MSEEGEICRYCNIKSLFRKEKTGKTAKNQGNILRKLYKFSVFSAGELWYNTPKYVKK